MARILIGVFVFFVGPAAGATPLVTGNGYGFAVLSQSSPALSGFYAHPYSFMRADPKDALGEGVPTTNFIRELRWELPEATTSAWRADYLEESAVFGVDDAVGRQVFFMPFAMERNALITAWTRSSRGPSACLRATWSKPASATRKQAAGREAWVLRFEGLPETLAVVPLDAKTADLRDGCFAGASAFALLPLASESDLAPAMGELTRWQGAASAARLTDRAVRRFEEWRVRHDDRRYLGR